MIRSAVSYHIYVLPRIDNDNERCSNPSDNMTMKMLFTGLEISIIIKSIISNPKSWGGGHRMGRMEWVMGREGGVNMDEMGGGG